MNDDITVIEAASILTPDTIHSPGRIVISSGRIRDIGPAHAVELPAGAGIVRLPTGTLVPGFIEPHIHGIAGSDIMDAGVETLHRVSESLVRFGTTSFFPTTLSAAPHILEETLAGLGRWFSESPRGARPIAIHMEGPFINPARRGTHAPLSIQAPSLALLQRFLTAAQNRVGLITIAPEVENAEKLLAFARSVGLAVAMGHSDATANETNAAVALGACYAVHTFNAMRPMTHRDPGILGAVLTDERIFAEVIADGIHVDPTVVRLFARAKGPDRHLLVTDAISAAGMADGTYSLGSQQITVLDGACRNAEGRLAGSALTQDRALRNFKEWTSWRLQDVVRGLTSNPAAALGISGKGVLKTGGDADMVLLDDDHHVVQTYVAGRRVFDRGSSK